MNLFKQIFTIGISITVTFLICIGVVAVTQDLYELVYTKIYEYVRRD